MQYALFLNTALPVRAEAKESAEMVTQLLFGDFCTVVEEQNSFVKIENHGDKYTGWCDKKMLSQIDEATYNQLQNQPQFRTCVPIADVFCLTNKQIYRLSAGSQIPLYNHETSSFEIAGKVYQIHPSFVTYLPQARKDNIVASALLFQNTPYLWGGKNLFGIDCSGLVQTVFGMNGYQLSRDANTQANEGIEIKSFSQAEATDLLFFEKDGKITHVGIYLGDSKIIHASGKVRIDKIDEEGIYNPELGQYTHRLKTIKRL